MILKERLVINLVDLKDVRNKKNCCSCRKYLRDTYLLNKTQIVLVQFGKHLKTVLGLVGERLKFLLLF